MKPWNFSQKTLLTILVVRKPPSLIEEWLLEEGLNFEGIIFFCQHWNRSFTLPQLSDDHDIVSIGDDIVDLCKSVEVGDILVFGIQDLQPILICGLILLVLLLEYCKDEVIPSELPDDSLLTVQNPVP